VIVGNKVRSVITINKKPTGSDSKIASASPITKATRPKYKSNKPVTIKRKKCGGCSRQRRV